MINQQVSDIFEQMADVMEIMGEDPFRINTYRKVARTVRDCGEDLTDLAQAGRLESLPGVGKSSAAKKAEYVEKGAIGAHQELLQKIPEGLLELLRIPGLGPKGVHAVWKQLQVTNLADLEKVINDHSLEALPGFGAKKAQAIAQGIAFVRSAHGRVLLCQAMMAAELIVGQLLQNKQIKRIEIAGSLRRCCETIGDVDLLAEGQKGAEIIERFTKLPGVREVLAAGETKGSVLFADPAIGEDAVQVDLRVVAPQSMGSAWQYFTGSKAHNVRLREIAIKKKLKLNEYGLFKGERQVAGKTETEIYDKLGLAYVPPTLREDRGEIELAQAGKLPAVVQLGDIRGDLHIHSPASDGRANIEDLIERAQQLGYTYLAITDHSVSETIANGLDRERLLRHVEEIRRLNQLLKGFTLLAGTEVDILMDGSLDYEDEVLTELDFVMASVHSGLTGPEEKVTRRVLRAMENPFVNCIGHPTGRMIHVREPMKLDIKAVLAQAAATGTALEVSASPYRLDLKDIHCRMAVEAGVKLVINTDAHDVRGMGEMHYGVATAQRGWVSKKDVLNCQPVSVVRRWVQKKRA